MASLEDQLEQLRGLINASIDIVQQDLHAHNDPPLNLSVSKRHPIRDRYNYDVARALKCISSSGLMLRALCDAEEAVHDVIFGFHDSTALDIVCRADVANLLTEHPLHKTELGVKTGINADKICRYLRALCNLHIFEEIEPEVFRNNELSLMLKSERKRALVNFCVEEVGLSSTRAWEALQRPDFKDAEEANKAPYCIAYNTDLDMFDYWKEVRPDFAQRGNLAFSGEIKLGQYLALYPWSAEKDGALVVDVGGGVGSATLPVVNQISNVRLLLEDRPATEPNFLQFLKREYPKLHNSGRVSFLGHDFFTEQPIRKADIYFLRYVIHGWPDTKSIQILKNIRCAMSSSSKVLLCERVIFPTYRAPAADKNEDEDVAGADEKIAPQPLLANWGDPYTTRLDLQVLACLNGRERTVAQHSDIVSKAGLVLAKVWKGIGGEAILECRLKQPNA